MSKGALCKPSKFIEVSCDVEIDSVSLASAKKAKITGELGKGTHNSVYRVLIDNEPIAAKIVSDEEVKYVKNEICTQQLVSEYGVAPAIRGAWSCNRKKHVILMGIANGITYYDYIDREAGPILPAFLACVETILFMNFEAHVIHGDMHVGNVMFDPDGLDDIKIIDFEHARSYDSIDDLNPYRSHGKGTVKDGAKKVVMTVLGDLIMFIERSSLTNEELQTSSALTFDAMLKRSKLTKPSVVYKLFVDLLRKHRRAPTPSEITDRIEYMLVRN